MNRRRTAAVLLASAALLGACGSPTVTPVPVASTTLEAPRDTRALVEPTPDTAVVAPLAAGLPTPAGSAGDGAPAPARVHLHARPAATSEPVQVPRKSRPVHTTPPAPADVPALVTPTLPTVDRGTRPVQAPPAVVTGQGSAGESVPGVPSVPISTAPPIDRGTRPVADPPVVVVPVEPAADALAVDDVERDVTLLEKER